MKEREYLIEKDATYLSVRKQSELLEVNRSNLYYSPVGESFENLSVMRLMNENYLENPTYSVLRMQDELYERGVHLNHKRVRKLMRKMGLEAIYPKPNLSRLGKAKYIHPYLLRNLSIHHPNKVWAIDITYIAMEKCFMYITVILDVYSRYIVGWRLSNTLDKRRTKQNCLRVV